MQKNSSCRMMSLLLLALLTLLPGGKVSAADAISAGEPFPQVPLPAPLEAEQRSYLGLVNDQPFTLNQVDGRIVLVEVLNVLCPHCQKQTQPYNKLFRMIEDDPVTRGRIKMLGVAVANDDEAIDDFVVIYSVAFPVVPDRTFKLHRALRAGPTPFSIYTLRDAPGSPLVVADTYLGEDHDMDELFDYLKYLLTMETADFTSLLRDEEVAQQEQLLPPQSEAEVAEMVRSSFAAQGDQIEDFRRLQLASGRWVYAASLLRDGRRQPLFAEVGNRSAICDICHSVHFFYVFDSSGLILDFVPLHLTKYGNVEWNKAEVDRFSSRVIGKRLTGSWHFEPKADAVTSATMTSAIIFDDLDQGRGLLEELREKKLHAP